MTWAESVSVVLGGIGVAAGVVLLGLSRRRESVRLPGVGRMDRPGLTALALSLGVSGYHLAAYGGPAGLITFRVRDDFGWLVFVLCGAAITGAVLTDRWLSDGDGPVR